MCRGAWWVRGCGGNARGWDAAVGFGNERTELFRGQLFPLYHAGNYRTQLYDKQREEYLPATPGLGMFVEVKDPDEKVHKAHDLSEVLGYIPPSGALSHGGTSGETLDSTPET